MSTGALQHEQNNGSLFSKTSPSRLATTNDNKDTKKEDNKNKLRDQYTSYLKTKGMIQIAICLTIFIVNLNFRTYDYIDTKYLFNINYDMTKQELVY